MTFQIRVGQELARVRRSGGFVSLAIFSASPGDQRHASRTPDVAPPLSASVRLQDVPGMHGAGVALLMPDATLDEGVRAAERILKLLPPVYRDRRPAAGVATVYGEVEGAEHALFAAAEEALAEASPGQVVRSRKLEGRPRVLIVDDDGEFANLLAETISARGFEAHPCTHGVDALKRAETETYGALFVDLVLRDASGLDVARRALKARPRRPVIMMSGYATTGEAILDALTLGPVMFVRKPIDHRELDAALAMVRQLLPGASHGR